MTMPERLPTHANPTERKAQLILEGARYRAAIRNARFTVANNLHAGMLIRSAVSQFSSNLYGVLGGLLRIRGNRLQTLLPLVLSAVSIARKTRLLTPLLRGTVVLGAVGTGIYLISRRKKTPTDRH